MRTVVAGNNKVASEVLEWLVEQGEEVVGVVPEGKDIVDRDERWEKPFQPIAEKISAEKGIPCYTGNINNFSEELKKLDPAVISLCRSLALVKPKILKIPKLGCTNLHYGELPNYGGCATLQWAILNGEDHVGVTLHYMSKEFDTGPIIDQRTIDITGKRRSLKGLDDVKICGLTAFEIYQRANDIAIQMYKNNYEMTKRGEVDIREQDHSKSTYYPASMLDFKTGKYIDLEGVDGEKLSRHIRAFTFPPKQLPIGRLKDGSEIILELKETK